MAHICQIGGRICVRAGRQSAKQGTPRAASEQKIKSLSVIHIWLEGTMDEAAIWGARLRESAMDTMWINTFHAGLITPRDLTNL
jgi:hypothetical protein